MFVEPSASCAVAHSCGVGLLVHSAPPSLSTPAAVRPVAAVGGVFHRTHRVGIPQPALAELNFFQPYESRSFSALRPNPTRPWALLTCACTRLVMSAATQLSLQAAE